MDQAKLDEKLDTRFKQHGVTRKSSTSVDQAPEGEKREVTTTKLRKYVKQLKCKLEKQSWTDPSSSHRSDMSQ